MRKEVYAIGLPPLEVHTLNLLISVDFTIIATGQLETHDYVHWMRSCSCIVINPRRLEPIQLSAILDTHTHCLRSSYAPMLLLSSSPTKTQLKGEAVNKADLLQVDLRKRNDIHLRNAINLRITASLPCWSGIERMKDVRFDDKWTLIDVETNGIDPLCNDIIAVYVAHMCNYQIETQNIIFIKQDNPIAEGIEMLTGITNEMLQNGVSLSKAIEEISQLSATAPIVFMYDDFSILFLIAAWHRCKQTFDLPYLAMDSLGALLFPQNLSKRTMKKTLARDHERVHQRTNAEDPDIAALYDLTASVFEALTERFGIQSLGLFDRIYDLGTDCKI